MDQISHFKCADILIFPLIYSVTSVVRFDCIVFPTVRMVFSESVSVSAVQAPEKSVYSGLSELLARQAGHAKHVCKYLQLDPSLVDWNTVSSGYYQCR